MKAELNLTKDELISLRKALETARTNNQVAGNLTVGSMRKHYDAEAKNLKHILEQLCQFPAY